MTHPWPGHHNGILPRSMQLHCMWAGRSMCPPIQTHLSTNSPRWPHSSSPHLSSCTRTNYAKGPRSNRQTFYNRTRYNHLYLFRRRNIEARHTRRRWRIGTSRRHCCLRWTRYNHLYLFRRRNIEARRTRRRWRIGTSRRHCCLRYFPCKAGQVTQRSGLYQGLAGLR